MLDKVIALIGAVFVLMLFVMSAAVFLGMMSSWYALQDEAQFLAASQGRYGGYTVEADNQLRQFVQNFKLNPGDVRVQVSAPNAPRPWGQTVTASITYPFQFKVGRFFTPFTVPLTGRGASVSTYIPGTYNVQYTSPSV